MSAWQFLKDGKFAEAVEAYTSLIRTDPSAANFTNRGIAHLNQGNCELAMTDFCQGLDIDGHKGDGLRKRIGTVHWVSGEYDDAAEVWLSVVSDLTGGQVSYTDGAGGAEAGALLWFAGLRLKNEDLCAKAELHLSGLCRSKRIGHWPGPVAEFVLGRITATDLLQRTSATPVLSARERSQAEFYIAAADLKQHLPDRYSAGMKAAARHTDALLENEYYLARHESRRCP